MGEGGGLYFKGKVPFMPTEIREREGWGALDFRIRCPSDKRWEGPQFHGQRNSTHWTTSNGDFGQSFLSLSPKVNTHPPTTRETDK